MDFQDLVRNLFVITSLTTSFGIILVAYINRYHFIVQMTRGFVKEIEGQTYSRSKKEILGKNLKIMSFRTMIMQRSILFLVLGMLINIVICAIFLLTDSTTGWIGNTERSLLMASVLSIALSFILFTFDMFISLKVLKREIEFTEKHYPLEGDSSSN